MYVKPNKLLFTSILFYCFVFARAATITISGPTQVCPTLTYTYTASASNSLGSKKGDFEWTFWRGNVLLGVIGGIGECPTSPFNMSSSTVTFNWGYDLGDVKIRVRFKGNNDPLCYGSGPDEKWLDVKVRVLSPGKISGLTFCSPNETRLVTVVPIPTVNDASTCFYHYKYEWIVPNGWSVIPVDTSYYENIGGGIRTGKDSVWITAPSNLQPGYSGNYMVTVRIEDQWPWPAQSSGQVWVGITDPIIESLDIRCHSENKFYDLALFATECPIPSQYDWYVDNVYKKTTVLPFADFFVGSVDRKFHNAQVRLTNLCSNGIFSLPEEGFYRADCGNSNNSYITLSPNPASTSLVIEIQENEFFKSKVIENINFVRIRNLKGEIWKDQQLKEKSNTIIVEDLPNGLYVAEFFIDGNREERMIEIKK